MLSLFMLLLVLCSSSIGEEETPVFAQDSKKHPLKESLGEERGAVAEEIESVLIEHGISSRLARAAVVNAIAESDLNPEAVGDKGKAVGVFQLHSKGLGSNVSNSSRKNVRISTARVVTALKKDKVLMRMQDECAPVDQLVSTFALRIMRPAKKHKRAKERVALSQKLQLASNDDCRPKKNATKIL
jgi:hypothetical protein